MSIRGYGDSESLKIEAKLITADIASSNTETSSTNRMPNSPQSDIHQSANKLSQLSRLSTIRHIDLPYRFVDDHEDYDTSYDKLIEPQWNQAVLLLDEGRGYSNLLATLERLNEKLQRSEERFNKEKQIYNSFNMVYNLFLGEASEHGADKKIGDSLGVSNPESANSDMWTWSVMQIGSGWKGEITELKNKYFPHVSDPFKRIYEAEKVPDYVTPVDENDTWQQVIDKTGKRGKRYSKWVDEYRGLVQIISFRIKLIEAVLYEYEILGFVDEYQPSANNRSIEPGPLDEDLITFIQVGCALYEENPTTFNGRESLISQTLEKLEWTTDTKKMRDDLFKSGLYNKGSKPGPPKKSQRVPLLEEMITLWKGFLRNGLKGNNGS